MSVLKSAEFLKFESLLAERDRLLTENIGLRDHHFFFPTKRQIFRSKLANHHREQLEQQGEKHTESQIRNLVSADPTFEAFIEESSAKRRQWLLVHAQIESLTYRIRFLLNTIGSGIDAIRVDEDELVALGTDDQVFDPPEIVDGVSDYPDLEPVCSSVKELLCRA